MAPRQAIYLEAAGASRILEAAERLAPGESIELAISLDLGLTETPVQASREELRWEGRAAPLDPLREIARKPRKIYCLEPGGAWEPLEMFTDRHYQLVPARGAPTLEIDGIQMHRTSGIGPFDWARQIAAVAVRPGDRVLDVCGGLGYSSIQAARIGAGSVISFELSGAVLELRRRNPWSAQEADLPIRLVPGDAFRSLAEGKAGEVDAIIHDPPRFALAPELYGEPFYRLLIRLLAPGGRLFHYTGSPQSRRGERDFHRGVQERLRRAGFEAQFVEELQGFTGRRARRPAGPPWRKP